MEIHELDNTLKKALLSKANEIQPSDETLIHILASLEKQPTRRTLNISYKHCVIALICAVSVLFGTILSVSADARASAIAMTNTVKSVFILDQSLNVAGTNTGKDLIKYTISDNTQPVNADISKKMGVNTLFLQTFAGCFLLNQVYDLGLSLRLLLIGRMTLGQTWYYNRFRPGQFPSY